MLVVVKVGSSTLVDAHGALDRAYIRQLCEQVSTLVEQGNKVIVVTSGAAAAGRESLGFSSRPSDIPSLQACAAAGQAALTQAYADVLAEQGIPCAQVLLTRRDVVDREGYLNARNTLERLLELGAVPVVNENDTVSVAEFAFGDNDFLGAIVSVLAGADLYIICSDVDGLYTANPQIDPTATLVSHVDKVDAKLMRMAGGTNSSVGTGGMTSKLRAARAMLAAGIPMVICEGREDKIIERVLSGEQVGTRFEGPLGSAHGNGLKLWIGLAEMPQGSLILDKGACRAMVERGASVLPVGIVRSEGSFQAGDVVNVVSEQGDLLARGITRYSSEDIARVHGLHLDVIARFMPDKGGQPAVHRDELLVF